MTEMASAVLPTNGHHPAAPRRASSVCTPHAANPASTTVTRTSAAPTGLASWPKGTPWHPHRGLETVTYMIDGIFQHQDSNGGGGLITDGDTRG
jgi:redox-sensitive bicupin YhaK (pirin superfamily)